MGYLLVVILWAIITACLATFFLLLAYKWRVIEWLQVHGNEFVSQLANCTFCLSWWTCLAVSLIFLVESRDLAFLFIPVVATPITRKML
jgi:hypothetical protein